MPYGKVSFVIKLSPLHPGYVITVCACTTANNVAAISAVDCLIETILIYVLLCFGFRSLLCLLFQLVRLSRVSYRLVSSAGLGDVSVSLNICGLITTLESCMVLGKWKAKTENRFLKYTERKNFTRSSNHSSSEEVGQRHGDPSPFVLSPSGPFSTSTCTLRRVLHLQLQ
jgi:hypothetical protein